MKGLIKNLLSKSNLLKSIIHKNYDLLKKVYLNIFVDFNSCKINEFENGDGGVQ